MSAHAIALPQVYRAYHGRLRTFLSLRDAVAYDQGVLNWPNTPEGPTGTPEWTGYFDAEQAALDRIDAQREEARRRYE